MISDAEVRREARRAQVEPRVIELDYVLGWALWGLARSESIRGRLVFKGGTCLRKCYIPHYRFSEDLDFTALQWLDQDAFRAGIGSAMADAATESGIDFQQDLHFDVVKDEYGKQSFQVRIYWHGPHSRRGSPRTVRMDISRGEAVEFAPVPRAVWHPYSDAKDMGSPATWNCYALEEVMAEKLRAVLPAKLQAKELSMEAMTAERMVERRAEFAADWNRNLVHLIPSERLPTFEEVWETAYQYARANVD